MKIASSSAFHAERAPSSSSVSITRLRVAFLSSRAARRMRPKLSQRSEYHLHPNDRVLLDKLNAKADELEAKP